MEQNDQIPAQGPILITGATGGVGSMAIDMFSSKGYEVVAITGKMQDAEYLRQLGATEILDRNKLDTGSKPMEKALWAGAVDNVGGEILTWLTRTIKPWGNITSVGLAGGAKLETTVMPFILRGVSLLGITSAGCPTKLRHKIWQRIATDLRPQHLQDLPDQIIALEDLDTVFDQMLQGKTHGRYIVKLAGDI